MSVNFDSHGMSALGERMQSVLDAFRKSVTPSQKHIGTVDIDLPISGVYAVGAEKVMLVESNVTIPSLGFQAALPGLVTLSGDLASILSARFRSLYVIPEDRPSWVSEKDGVIYIETRDDAQALGCRERAFHVATADVAMHDFTSELLNHVCVYASGHGSGRVHVYNDGLDPVILVTQPNGTFVGRHQYDHTTDFSAQRACYDGAAVFLIGRFSSTTAEIVVIKISLSSFSVLSAKRYTLPAGTVAAFLGAAVVDSGVIMLAVTRATGQQPVRLGINTSDLSVAWAKTTRKQTVAVTVGVNDTATTYRITIAGQTESALGNATGANATAVDLRAACAASAQSQFTARTWTVSDNVVTGIANVAGITWDTTVSVTGGTGTISRADTKNLYPLVFDSTIWGGHASGGAAVLGGSGGGFYGIAAIDILTGDVSSAALSNELHGAGGVGLQMITSIDGDVYAVGRTGRAGTIFGSPGVLDVEVIPFSPAVPSNISFLDDAITMTVTDEPASNFTETHKTSGFASVSDARVPLQTPSETIQVADTDYTF